MPVLKFPTIAMFSGSFSGSFIGDGSGLTGTSGGGSTPTGSLLTTASVDLNTITFTKGNGSTFLITVNTGSGGGGSAFPFTGNAVITGSLIVTGSTISTLGFTGSLSGIADTASFMTTSSLRSSTAPYVVYTDVTEESTTSTSTSNLLTTFGFTIPDTEWPVGGMLKITGHVERTAGANNAFSSVQVNGSTLRYVGIAGTSMVFEYNIMKINSTQVRIAYGPSNTGQGSYNVHNAASVTSSISASNYAIAFGLYTGATTTYTQRWMKGIMIP
jgi:hypothetical protein